MSSVNRRGFFGVLAALSAWAAGRRLPAAPVSKTVDDLGGFIVPPSLVPALEVSLASPEPIYGEMVIVGHAKTLEEVCKLRGVVYSSEVEPIEGDKILSTLIARSYSDKMKRWSETSPDFVHGRGRSDG